MKQVYDLLMKSELQIFLIINHLADLDLAISRCQATPVGHKLLLLLNIKSNSVERNSLLIHNMNINN